MAIYLKKIKTYTADENNYADVEYSNGSLNNLYDWFSLSSAVIDEFSFVPSTEYPFKISENSSIGYSPFTQVYVQPYLSVELSSICIEVEDYSLEENKVFCFDYTYNYNIYNPVSTVLLDDVTDLNSSEVSFLISDGNNVELQDYNVLWNSNNTITYRRNRTTLYDYFTEPSITFSIENNKLYSIYTFPSEAVGSFFKKRWDILSKCLTPFNIQKSKNGTYSTNVDFISGKNSNQYNLFSIPLSTSGCFSNLTLSSQTGIYNLDMTCVFSDNGNKLSYKTLKQGNIEFNLNTTTTVENYVVSLSSNNDISYIGYIIKENSFSNVPNTYFDLKSLKGVSEGNITPESYNNKTSLFGSKWYTFINNDSGDSIELNKHNSVWDLENNLVEYNSIQGEKDSVFDSNFKIKKLKNNSVGISLDNQDSVWNIKGIQLSFNDECFSTNKWRSYKNEFVDKIIDRSDSPWGFWSIILEDYDELQVKKYEVSYVYDDSVSYNVTKINQTKKYNEDFSLVPYVSSDGNTNELIVRSSNNFNVQIYRTDLKTVQASSVYISNGSGDVIVDNSPHENNIWFVFGESVNNKFISKVYQDDVYVKSDFTCGFSVSSLDFFINKNGSSYELHLSDSNSDTWNLSAIRIDDSDKIQLPNLFFTTELSSKNNETWWIENEYSNDIRSTRLVDYVWQSDLKEINNCEFTIKNKNTSSNLLSTYDTLASVYTKSEVIGDTAYGKIEIEKLIWSLYGYDYNKELSKISYYNEFSVISNTDNLFDYIFSHPNTYTLNVSGYGETIEETKKFEDFYSIKDIPSTSVVLFSTTSFEGIENDLVPYPNTTHTSYYNTSLTNEVSTYQNTLYFAFFETKAGSFPLKEIYIDWGDGSGTTKINKNGPYKKDINTKVYAFDGLFEEFTDPRQYYVSHAFSSDNFVVSVSTISVDTFTVSTTILNIDYKGVNLSQGFNKRLVKSDMMENGNVIYNVLIKETETEDFSTNPSLDYKRENICVAIDDFKV